MKAALILFSAFLTVSTISFAGNGDSAVDKLMNRKISYPEALRSKHIEATVSVKLRINEKGRIEIMSIQSDSPEMREAVQKQVNNLKFKATSDLVGKEFDYKFNFKIQE